jgi:hypothetical protein
MRFPWFPGNGSPVEVEEEGEGKEVDGGESGSELTINCKYGN